MKKIKKILMFSILLVLPFLFSSKVFAFDYFTEVFIGRTRLVEGSTSDSMHIEFETDNGYVEFYDLSLMLSDYDIFYSDKSYVGYIFSFPMSLKNPTSSGMPIKLYPAGTTLVLSNIYEVPVAFFFSANWEELDFFFEEDLIDHYFEYDLFVDDYFIGYNQGYLAGYDEGLIDGDLAGYEDGLIDGDQAGYERGYLAGYENGYLAGQEDQVPDPTPPGSGVIVPPHQETSKTKYIIITVLVIAVLIAAAYYIYNKKYKSKAKRK